MAILQSIVWRIRHSTGAIPLRIRRTCSAMANCVSRQVVSPATSLGTRNWRSNGLNTSLNTAGPELPSIEPTIPYHVGEQSKAMDQDNSTERTLSAPPIWMSRHVRCQIMCTIGARRPETGGILLGPIGSNDITDFYFDATASCSGATYTPDYVTLRRKMQEGWMPAGLDMKGFVHSHPGEFDRLSHGDLAYIRRLLERNLDMSVFAAPIVIPQVFRLRAIVVLADRIRLPPPADRGAWSHRHRPSAAILPCGLA